MSVSIGSGAGSSIVWDVAADTWASVSSSINWDTYVSTAFTFTNTESLSFSELLLNSYTRKEIQALSITSGELYKSSFNKKLDEGLAIAETMTHVWMDIINIIESISISDTLKNNFNRDKFTETFSISDGNTPKSFNFTKKSLEGWTTSDIRKINFNRKVTDGWTTSDLSKKNIAPYRWAETFSITDNSKPKSFNFTKNNLEDLSIGEMWNELANYNVYFAESINTSDLLKNSFVKENFYEWLTITDYESNYYAMKLHELCNIAELGSNTVNYYITANEVINITELVKKTFNLNKDDAIRIIDSLLRHANAVVSDISIFNTELTLDNFENAMTPVGYTGFQPFQTGDYTYKDALIRVILSAGVTSDRPNINKWEFNVDIPDTSDRGSAHCLTTNQPLFVPFNRTFHVPPEVIVQIKSGATTTSRVFIDSITKDGFTVELKDGATHVDGWITWSSEGY